MCNLFFGSPHKNHLQIAWINDQLAQGAANGYATGLQTWGGSKLWKNVVYQWQLDSNWDNFPTKLCKRL